MREHRSVIVVVEGVSAAGKSTWCRRHYPLSTVAEAAAGETPEEWQRANETRWAEAEEVAQRCGLAICDTDPFKLHYVWSLWRIGEGDAARWREGSRLARAAFTVGTLGLADLVLLADADDAELERRRESDAADGRARRSFELHRRLREPLREWYAAVDSLDPGRVRFGLPANGNLGPPPAPRAARTGGEVFDALVAALPQS